MAGKKKFLKIVIIAAALIVIIGVAAVSILVANLDSIARKAIVEVMEFVLQVDVSLAKVDISVREGGCTLKKLVIGNPKGFKSKEFFSVDRVDVKVDIKSFKSDEPVIHLVSMTNPEITLEQGLTKSNMSVIIKNASRFETEEEEEKKGSEKKIRIDKVIVKGSKVSITSPILQGEGVSVSLPQIEMNDIGGKKEPVTIAKSIKIFFTKMLEAIVKEAGDVLPPDLDKKLKGALDDVAGSLKEAPEMLEDTGKELKEGVEDAAKGLKGLFKK